MPSDPAPGPAGPPSGPAGSVRVGRRPAPARPPGDGPAEGLQFEPPHSDEAELGVVASILHDPEFAVPICLQQLERDAFYSPNLRAVYTTLVEMYDQREYKIDLITLIDRLRALARLEQAGGIQFVSDLPRAVPTVANLPNYVRIVREKHLLRRVMRAATDLVQEIYGGVDDVDRFLDSAEQRIFDLSARKGQTGPVPIREVMVPAVAMVERYYNRRGELPGLASGYPDLDRLTGGFRSGEMIVLAARPSVGKTALAMNMAESIALEEKKPVGIFSLEMNKEQLVIRMLCSRARVNLQAVRDGFLTGNEFPKLVTAASQLAGAPIFIDDTAGLSLMDLRARARRMRQQHELGLLVIDYLQLVRAEGRRIDTREQEISAISGGLKALAKELAMPILVLSQLNREVEKRGEDARPRLSDLRESGAIEQDADVVALLVRRVAGPGEGEQDERSEASLILAKQRNGPTGEVPLTFVRQYTRFESRARDFDEPGDGVELEQPDEMAGFGE